MKSLCTLLLLTDWHGLLETKRGFYNIVNLPNAGCKWLRSLSGNKPITSARSIPKENAHTLICIWSHDHDKCVRKFRIKDVYCHSANKKLVWIQRRSLFPAISAGRSFYKCGLKTDLHSGFMFWGAAFSYIKHFHEHSHVIVTYIVAHLSTKSKRKHGKQNWTFVL